MFNKITKKWFNLRTFYHITRNLYAGVIKKEALIVLTIGKVGSSSVFQTLKKETSKHCFHIHSLSLDGLQRQLNFHRKFDKGRIPPHIRLAQFFRNKILKSKKDIYFIVIIRNPIDRIISAIFEHQDKFKIKKFRSINDQNYLDAIELIEFKISEKGVENEFDIWIQEELEETLGIDIYSQQYNQEKGYNIYKFKNRSMLLIKMERLNNDFASALKIFLSTQQEIKLEAHNISNEKEYKEEYSLIKNNLKIDKKIIDNYTNTKYFQHFYAGQEEEVLIKWGK